MKRAGTSLVILLILTALLALAGCGQAQTTAGEGKLLMMGNENMAFLEIVDGQPTGFSADLAAQIADRLGRTLEVTIVPFPELFTKLKDGECDIVMSAVSITPERQAEVDFSDPYFSSGQALLVPIDSSIGGESDLKGKTVGVLRDSTNQQEAEGIRGIKKIVPFDSKEPLFAALVAGELDAVICDTPFAQYNAKETGKTRIAEELTRGDVYGIAVKKGNAELVTQINEALASINQDGTYDRLYEEYFGQ
jgi:ABC-type amino acid transport substrate-binding protein